MQLDLGGIDILENVFGERSQILKREKKSILREILRQKMKKKIHLIFWEENLNRRRKMGWEENAGRANLGRYEWWGGGGLVG